MKVWTWQTPLVRWTQKNTEDVIQTRLREIDRFFFIIRGRRLFTEVLAPDGIASGLAQLGLFMGDKNAPDEFGAVLQGAIDIQKEWWHLLGAVSLRTSECSCGVTLFADDVFEKGLLEKGTADECEHTVARRMGEVNSALETCGLRQNARKLVILPNLRRVLEKQAGVPDKGFPPFSGHCVSCHALDG